jgi:hypothetical protein
VQSFFQLSAGICEKSSCQPSVVIFSRAYARLQQESVGRASVILQQEPVSRISRKLSEKMSLLVKLLSVFSRNTSAEIFEQSFCQPSAGTCEQNFLLALRKKNLPVELLSSFSGNHVDRSSVL